MTAPRDQHVGGAVTGHRPAVPDIPLGSTNHSLA